MPEKRTDKPAPRPSAAALRPHPEPEPPETVDKPAELQAEEKAHERELRKELKEDSGIRRAGREDGYPEAVFDKCRKQWFSLDDNGEKQWIEVPQGFTFDSDGRPIPEE